MMVVQMPTGPIGVGGTVSSRYPVNFGALGWQASASTTAVSRTHTVSKRSLVVTAFIPREILGSEYQQLNPIPVYFALGPEYWTATDEVSAIFGIGDTPVEAFRDYAQSLVEQLGWFDENEQDLGPGLQAEHSILRQYFMRARPSGG